MSNPYEPPKAPLETSQTRPGLRWRLIPSLFMVLFGASLVLMSVMSVVLEFVRSWRLMNPIRPAPTIGMVIMSIAGILWTVCGAMLWKRRWWLAALFLLVGMPWALLVRRSSEVCRIRRSPDRSDEAWQAKRPGIMVNLARTVVAEASRGCPPSHRRIRAPLTTG
jgi:hypothetical protein